MYERTEQATPRAREAKLVIQEADNEVLVYDLKQHKAYCLNQTVAQVWKYCDGQTTVAEMATRLAQDFNTAVDQNVVWYALERLDRAQLLQERLARPAEARLSRRGAMRKLGVGAALTIPVVTAIVAPSAVSAQTCRANGTTGCTVNSQCCSGCCDIASNPNECRANSGTGGGRRATGVACNNNNQCCSQNCTGGVCA